MTTIAATILMMMPTTTTLTLMMTRARWSLHIHPLVLFLSFPHAFVFKRLLFHSSDPWREMSDWAQNNTFSLIPLNLFGRAVALDFGTDTPFSDLIHIILSFILTLMS